MKFIGYCFLDNHPEGLNFVGFSQIHFPFTIQWKKGISILSLSNNGQLIVHNFWIKILQRRYKKYFSRKYINPSSLKYREIYGHFKH